MRGEQFIINSLILKNLQNPIKQDIGKHSALHIIEVIEDEYWKELAMKMQQVDTLSVTLRYLGVFTPNLSKLKGYIRRSVKMIRKLRVRIKRLETTENFNPNNSITVAMERDLVIKVRKSWKQLDELRQLIVIRTIRMNNARRRTNNLKEISVNYEWFDFSFVPKMLIITNYPLK